MANNMLNQIAQHDRDIEGLKFEIEQLNEAVESKTSEAKELLLRYRELKHLAALALQEVADGYRKAQSCFKKSDRLAYTYNRIKREHLALCESVLALEENEPDQAEPLIEKLQASRLQLKEIYKILDSMQKEIEPAECEGSLI